jgi:hypothetical protein
VWLTLRLLPYGSGFNEIKFHEKFDLTKINVRFRRDENFRRLKTTTLGRFLSGAVRTHPNGGHTPLRHLHAVCVITVRAYTTVQVEGSPWW